MHRTRVYAQGPNGSIATVDGIGQGLTVSVPRQMSTDEALHALTLIVADLKRDRSWTPRGVQSTARRIQPWELDDYLEG